MSHVAIAAALALEDLSTPERLVAFSLASYANPEQHAWPGHNLAAARAGLSRSSYLEARVRLDRRGVICAVPARGGRGHKGEVILAFARTGPRWDARINPGLFEAVLSYSRAVGSPRLLLATLAALADDHGTVAELTTAEIRQACGLSDGAYRRARAAVLAGGEALATGTGGRGNTNRWQLADPRRQQPAPPTRHRVPPPAGARPLLSLSPPAPTHALAERDKPARGALEREAAARALTPSRPTRWGPVGARTSETRAPGVRRELAVCWTALGDRDRGAAVVRTGALPTGRSGRGAAARSSVNPATSRTLSRVNPATSRTLSPINPATSRTLSERNPATGRTLSDVNPARNPATSRAVSRQTPPQTPPETPPPTARAGREPGNQGTTDPPSPPSGGCPPGTVSIIEDHLSASGRRRHRVRTLNAADICRDLRPPTDADRRAWEDVRHALAAVADAATFAIWLAPLQLAGVDPDATLVVVGTPELRSWLVNRFGAAISTAATAAGRPVRIAADHEHQALALSPTTSVTTDTDAVASADTQQEVS